MRTLEVGTRMSRSFGPSTKSIAYCKPEQPPPTTARRNAPFGFPFFSSNDASLFAALSVTRIRRSLPIFQLVGDVSVLMKNSNPKNLLQNLPGLTGQVCIASNFAHSRISLMPVQTLELERRRRLRR